MAEDIYTSMSRPNEEHRFTRRSTKVPESFLKQLREDIAFRRIDSGIQLLRRHREFIASCSPKQRNAAVFVGHLAQWADIGFASPKLVKELLGKFPSELRVGLSVHDFVHLQMAEGFIAMCDQEDEAAIRHFQIVLAIQSEVQNEDLITIANFWIGRCYRRLSRYRDALEYVIRARESATRSEHLKTVAVIQVLEGWLLFQEGKVNDAVTILGAAEELLAETDDYVARGNLNSTYSRIARRNGEFDEALRRSEIAIQEFKKRDQVHRNLARSLVNNAFVKRLIALNSSEKIDTEVARTRNVPAKGHPPNGFDIQRERERVKALREDAARDLIEAAAISSRYHDYRGEGDVQITYGYLCLDDGDFEVATARAVAGYKLGIDKKDTVIKARSRILQSAIEFAKVEEQIVEGAGSRRSTRLASEYAREAVEYARETQNRQLIAQALITFGLALLNEGDTDGARSCCDQATELLKPDTRDYAWKELQELKTKLNRSGNIDTALREWSRGSVGNKTFQQITEDFAAIVIPKVWRREGHKISRVAERLSISPKKVRRILRRQGIIAGTD